MKNLGWIITIAILSAAIIVVVLYLLLKPKELKLVEGQGDVDRLQNGNIDKTRYRSIAGGAKNSLSGANYQNTFFVSVANQLLALNPNELRVVVNIYNQEFKSKEAPTLRALVMGEFVGSSAFGTIPTPCTEAERAVQGSPCNLQAQVVERLNQINA